MTQQTIREWARQFNSLRLKRIEAKFDIPKNIYAIMFDHPDGWTFIKFENTAAKAQVFIRDNARDYKCRIIPCVVTPKIPVSVLKALPTD